jgi:hypothetical protein
MDNVIWGTDFGHKRVRELEGQAAEILQAVFPECFPTFDTAPSEMAPEIYTAPDKDSA